MDQSFDDVCSLTPRVHVYALTKVRLEMLNARTVRHGPLNFLIVKKAQLSFKTTVTALLDMVLYGKKGRVGMVIQRQSTRF